MRRPWLSQVTAAGTGRSFTGQLGAAGAAGVAVAGWLGTAVARVDLARGRWGVARRVPAEADATGVCAASRLAVSNAVATTAAQRSAYARNKRGVAGISNRTVVNIGIGFSRPGPLLTRRWSSGCTPRALHCTRLAVAHGRSRRACAGGEDLPKMRLWWKSFAAPAVSGAIQLLWWYFQNRLLNEQGQHLLQPSPACFESSLRG